MHCFWITLYLRNFIAKLSQMRWRFLLGRRFLHSGIKLDFTARSPSFAIGNMLSSYIKERILNLHFTGLRPGVIYRQLSQEGHLIRRKSIYDIIKHYAQTGSLERKPRDQWRRKVTPAILAFIEQQMENNDETTAEEMRNLIEEQLGVLLTSRTVLRARKSLGWTFRGTKYCQLIREVNKTKRLDFVSQYANFDAERDVENVIFTDETTVALENHKRMCCRKQGQPPKPKPVAKHPVKVSLGHSH